MESFSEMFRTLCNPGGPGMLSESTGETVAGISTTSNAITEIDSRTLSREFNKSPQLIGSTVQNSLSTCHGPGTRRSNSPLCDAIFQCKITSQPIPDDLTSSNHTKRYTSDITAQSKTRMRFTDSRPSVATAAAGQQSLTALRPPSRGYGLRGGGVQSAIRGGSGLRPIDIAKTKKQPSSKWNKQRENHPPISIANASYIRPPEKTKPDASKRPASHGNAGSSGSDMINTTRIGNDTSDRRTAYGSSPSKQDILSEKNEYDRDVYRRLALMGSGAGELYAPLNTLNPIDHTHGCVSNPCHPCHQCQWREKLGIAPDSHCPCSHVICDEWPPEPITKCGISDLDACKQRKMFADLTHNLDHLQDKLDHTMREVSHKEEEMLELRQTIETLRSQQEKLNDLVQQGHIERESMQKALEAKCALANTFRLERDQLSQLLFKKGKDIEALQTDNANVRSEADELQETFETRTQYIDELQCTIAQSEQVINSLEYQVKDLQCLSKHMQEERDNLQKEITSLKSDLANSHEMTKAIQCERDEIARLLDRTSTIVSENCNSIEALQKENAYLENALENIETENADLRNYQLRLSGLLKRTIRRNEQLCLELESFVASNRETEQIVASVHPPPPIEYTPAEGTVSMSARAASCQTKRTTCQLHQQPVVYKIQEDINRLLQKAKDPDVSNKRVPPPDVECASPIHSTPCISPIPSLSPIPAAMSVDYTHKTPQHHIRSGVHAEYDNAQRTQKSTSEVLPLRQGSVTTGSTLSAQVISAIQTLIERLDKESPAHKISHGATMTDTLITADTAPGSGATPHKRKSTSRQRLSSTHSLIKPHTRKSKPRQRSSSTSPLAKPRKQKSTSRQRVSSTHSLTKPRTQKSKSRRRSSSTPSLAKPHTRKSTSRQRVSSTDSLAKPHKPRVRSHTTRSSKPLAQTASSDPCHLSTSQESITQQTLATELIHVTHVTHTEHDDGLSRGFYGSKIPTLPVAKAEESQPAGDYEVIAQARPVDDTMKMDSRAPVPLDEQSTPEHSKGTSYSTLTVAALQQHNSEIRSAATDEMSKRHSTVFRNRNAFKIPEHKKNIIDKFFDQQETMPKEPEKRRVRGTKELQEVLDEVDIIEKRDPNLHLSFPYKIQEAQQEAKKEKSKKPKIRGPRSIPPKSEICKQGTESSRTSLQLDATVATDEQKMADSDKGGITVDAEKSDSQPQVTLHGAKVPTTLPSDTPTQSQDDTARESMVQSETVPSVAQTTSAKTIVTPPSQGLAVYKAQQDISPPTKPHLVEVRIRLDQIPLKSDANMQTTMATTSDKSMQDGHRLVPLTDSTCQTVNATQQVMAAQTTASLTALLESLIHVQPEVRESISQMESTPVTSISVQTERKRKRLPPQATPPRPLIMSHFPSDNIPATSRDSSAQTSGRVMHASPKGSKSLPARRATSQHETHLRPRPLMMTHFWDF